MKSIMLLIVVMLAALTQAQTNSVWNIYMQTGEKGESFNLKPDAPSGETTKRSYHNLVLIEVSGWTSLNPGEASDAFYVFQPIIPSNVYASDYCLTYSFNATPEFSPSGDGEGIRNLIQFIDGVGTPVYSGNVPLPPPYRSDHDYIFVIDLGSYSGPITFGFGGADWRHGRIGRLKIDLTPVESIPIPLAKHNSSGAIPGEFFFLLFPLLTAVLTC